MKEEKSKTKEERLKDLYERFEKEVNEMGEPEHKPGFLDAGQSRYKEIWDRYVAEKFAILDGED